jgi:hypothetical protein
LLTSPQAEHLIRRFAMRLTMLPRGASGQDERPFAKGLSPLYDAAMSLEDDVGRDMGIGGQGRGGNAPLDALDDVEWRRLILNRIDGLREAVIRLAQELDKRS